jgi:hypothetical protein
VEIPKSWQQRLVNFVKPMNFQTIHRFMVIYILNSNLSIN